MVWAGALALVVTVLAFVSVVGSSPQACATCHAASADGLAATVHADLDCYACHAPSPGAVITFKASELLGMYPSRLIGGSVEGSPAARMADSSCRSCHSATLDAVQPTVARGLRILHSACTTGASCLTCHSVVGHADATRVPQSASMRACVDCHTSSDAPISCETCHTSGYERDDLLRGPFRVTHGANWKQTHGMGDLRQCVLCHDQQKCASCHGAGVPHPADFGSSHGATSLLPDADCSSCHRTEFCSDCHGVEMPHAPEFLPQHSKLTTGLDDERCLRCHTAEDCMRCHARHVHPGGAADRR